MNKELRIVDLGHINRFPDGDSNFDLKDPAYVSVYDGFNVINYTSEDTTLVASIKSLQDLYHVAQVKQMLPNLIHLRINYLFAARLDKPYDPENQKESFNLKIVADWINTVGFEQVSILQPHSSVALSLIKNAVSFSVNERLLACMEAELGITEYNLVSPDKGASSWTQYYKTPNGGFVQLKKTRSIDKYGERQLVVDYDTDYPNTVTEGLPFVILDDMCDGGRTFEKAARLLSNKELDLVYLVITHAVFEKVPSLYGITHTWATNSWTELKSNGRISIIHV
jgi:ribose-phosphate pyrophosphokinase